MTHDREDMPRVPWGRLPKPAPEAWGLTAEWRKELEEYIRADANGSMFTVGKVAKAAQSALERITELEGALGEAIGKAESMARHGHALFEGQGWDEWLERARTLQQQGEGRE